MQAKTYILKNRGYDPFMAMGRPPTKERTEFAQRLVDARKAAGITQKELAERVGVSQRVVAYWERESIGLKADQLTALAEALNTSVDVLLGKKAKPPRRGGPKGRARRLFEQIEGMPRAQQGKVLDMIETIVAGQIAQSQSNDS